jgi:hypothetical protein
MRAADPPWWAGQLISSAGLPVAWSAAAQMAGVSGRPFHWTGAEGGSGASCAGSSAAVSAGCKTGEGISGHPARRPVVKAIASPAQA